MHAIRNLDEYEDLSIDPMLMERCNRFKFDVLSG